MKVAAPEKELRFTRSRQAIVFYLSSSMLMGVAITILVTSYYRSINPELPHPLWALALGVIAVLLFVLAQRMTKHAYLILTPLGVEIFPFFRPSKTMTVIYWQEIQFAQIDPKQNWLTLYTNEERSSGVGISLAPIQKKIRPLLAKAVLGRVTR